MCPLPPSPRPPPPQGAAYTDLLEGTYYPAVSLYTHRCKQSEAASVRVNFGSGGGGGGEGPSGGFAFPPLSALPASVEGVEEGRGGASGLAPRPFGELPGPQPGAAVPTTAPAEQQAPGQAQGQQPGGIVQEPEQQLEEQLAEEAAAAEPAQPPEAVPGSKVAPASGGPDT